MNLRLGRRCLGSIGVAALGGGEAAVLLWGRSLWHSISGPMPASLSTLVGLVSAGIAASLGLWLALGLVVAVLARAPGRLGVLSACLADRIAPAAARRWAAALVGASLGTGLGAVGAPALAVSEASPAIATAAMTRHGSEPSPGFTSTQGPGLALPGAVPRTPAEPGWTPTRPPVRHDAPIHLVSTMPRARGWQDPASASLPSGMVVVRRGDSLWSLVRCWLGPGATDAEVVREWPRWHAANREVIGADPALIHPGQLLQPPPRVGTGS